MLSANQIANCSQVGVQLVSFAAVSWGGALRDDPNNGCEGD